MGGPRRAGGWLGHGARSGPHCWANQVLLGQDVVQQARGQLWRVSVANRPEPGSLKGRHCPSSRGREAGPWLEPWSVSQCLPHLLLVPTWACGHNSCPERALGIEQDLPRGNFLPMKEIRPLLEDFLAG